jgi:predicted dehydrogenase
MTGSIPNIGFVGLGWPGERHAEGVIGSSLGIVHGACDLNQERLEKFVTTFRPARAFTDFTEMLSDAALDAVVISLPNALHYPFSLKTLQAGFFICSRKEQVGRDG